MQKLEIKYQHRPFRKLKDTTSIFPDDKGNAPIIHGPIGSDVELTVHASRPIKSANVEIATKTGKRDLPGIFSQTDPQAFTCRFTLDQPGQFRIAFAATDGEENSDRDAHPILVAQDDGPKVVLTQPGSDVSLPENGTLNLAGSAQSARRQEHDAAAVIGGVEPIKLTPQPFRPGVAFAHADGTWPMEIAYQDFMRDQIKNEAGAIEPVRAGSVIEYWLEATDAADYPNAAGNVGRSPAFKITLLPKAKDSAGEESERKAAIERRNEFQRKLDENGPKGGQNPDPKQNPNSGPESGGRRGIQCQAIARPDQQRAKPGEQESQRCQAEGAGKQGRGESKGPGQQHADKKEGPQNPGESPQPQPKPAPMTPPNGAGDKKDQGDGKGQSGQSRRWVAREKER